MTRRLALASGVAAACVLTARAARADLAYELSPAATVGATDNVSATGQHTADQFSQVSGALRLRYTGASATHVLGYTLSYSKYLQKTFPDTLSHTVSWLSTFNPSARWSLRTGAIGTVARASGLDAADPTTATPNTVVAGSSLYLMTTATQSIEAQPSARWNYGELLQVGYLRYLDAMFAGMPGVLPRTLYAMFGLHGERLVGREAFTVEADVNDSSTTYAGAAAANMRPTGQWIFGRALLGWRHELSPAWSTWLQAGPAVIYLVGSGAGVAAPVGIAALNYARAPWFASLIAEQTPMANPYLGAAILADQVTARLAIPLTRNDRVVAGGFGGYSYARIADANGHFSRAYDAFVGGLTLAYRFPKMPLVAMASYTVTSQRGGDVPGFMIPDRGYEYAFLTLRGDLAWGRGTPPIFGGTL
jgi:hypothetical protein